MDIFDQMKRARSKQEVRKIAKEVLGDCAAYQEDSLPFHKVLYAALDAISRDKISQSW